MSLLSELRTYTLGGAAVAALAGTRMYARNLPQTPGLPAVVYQRIDTRREHDHDGPDGVPRPRVQVTSWAGTPAAAEELAAAVRERLDGFRGAWGAVEVQSCLCVGERDVDDPDVGRVGVAQDYMIQYRED